MPQKNGAKSRKATPSLSARTTPPATTAYVRAGSAAQPVKEPIGKAPESPRALTEGIDMVKSRYEPKPAEAVRAVGQRYMKTLHVHVRSHLAESDVEPLAGVTVLLTDETGTFTSTCRTDAEGEARWSGLDPNRRYRAALADIQGYSIESGNLGGASVFEKGQFQYFKLEADHNRLDFHLHPKQAGMIVRAYLEMSDESGHHKLYITNVPIQVFHEGRWVHSVETVAADDATTTILNVQGLVALEPPPLLELENGQRIQPAVRGKILATLQPGGMVPIEIPFVATQAELRVAATLKRRHEHHDEEIHLPHATFRLYAGMKATGIPVRERTTRTVGEIVSFIDLPAGDYTLVGSFPTSYQGRPIHPRDNREPVRHLHLESGQRLDLTEEFLFVPRTGRVTVFAIDDHRGAFLHEVPVRLLLANGQGMLEPLPNGHPDRHTGTIVFDDVPLGVHTLGTESVFIGDDGTKYAPATTQGLTVAVTETNLNPVILLHVRPDEAYIHGHVTSESGERLNKIRVEVFDETRTRMLCSTLTDGTGYYRCPVPESGRYFVAFPELSEEKYEAICQSPAVVDLVFNQRAAALKAGTVRIQDIPPARGSDAQEAVIDLTAYPLLTESIGTRPRGDGREMSRIENLASNALIEVLGYRPKTKETNAAGTIRASLMRSFTPRTIEGRTVFDWTPRSYAVQSELGGKLTGAQASIYVRARTALDESLPLLDGLYPLRADADPQQVEAARAIVRTELSELVAELGLEGGPRAQRVDEMFERLDERLIGNNYNGLPAVFGFDEALMRQRQGAVITVDEEQNLTNFLIIRDYVGGLRDTWNEFKETFTSGAFLGTQLVLLSRALAVVAESAEEVAFALDSVLIGQAERQTLLVKFTDHTTPMTIGDLLAWVSNFATGEGPRLIQEGGRWGIEAILPKAKRLKQLVADAANPATNGVPNKGFNSPRVRRSIEALAAQLGTIATLAGQLIGEEASAKRG